MSEHKWKDEAWCEQDSLFAFDLEIHQVVLDWDNLLERVQSHHLTQAECIQSLARVTQINLKP